MRPANPDTWYALNKERVTARRQTAEFRAMDRLWRASNRKKLLIHAAKARAKKYGLEFDLSERSISWPDRCPIYGILLNYKNNEPKDDSPAIDRIDNSMGYTIGNVHVISCRANRHKSDATNSELRTLADYLERLR